MPFILFKVPFFPLSLLYTVRALLDPHSGHGAPEALQSGRDISMNIGRTGDRPFPAIFSFAWVPHSDQETSAGTE
jgi:hypothetical protein